jgi:predicted RNA-binding Zn ribbon-like protein
MGNKYRNLELMADFFNTYDKRMRFEGDPGVECLKSPDDLNSFMLEHELISKYEKVTEHDLALAVKLRDETRKTIINNHSEVNDNDLNTLNEVIQNFKFTINLSYESGEVRPVHTNGKKGLANLTFLIYELKRDDLWNRIRICSAPDCQWVFVDHSRPGTGRWCSMKACGNRAKNRAFRERRK